MPPSAGAASFPSKLALFFNLLTLLPTSISPSKSVGLWKPLPLSTCVTSLAAFVVSPSKSVGLWKPLLLSTRAASFPSKLALFFNLLALLPTSISFTLGASPATAAALTVPPAALSTVPAASQLFTSLIISSTLPSADFAILAVPPATAAAFVAPLVALSTVPAAALADVPAICAPLPPNNFVVLPACAPVVDDPLPKILLNASSALAANF